MYSPTISSFYTNRDRANTATPARSIPLENVLPPSYFTENNPRSHVSISSSNFVNRASSMIPYMGFLSRLIQLMVNKATVIWILIALDIKFFGSSVVYSLEQVKSADNISCLYLKNDFSQSSFLSYLNTANLAYTESTLTTMYNNAQKNLDYLEAAYAAIVNSTIQAAVYSADNATTALSTWTTDKLNSAIANTTTRIKSLESALSSISSALESSSVFESSGLGNATDISLSDFDLPISTDINSDLVSANASLSSYLSEFSILKNTASENLKSDFSRSYDQLALVLNNSTDNTAVTYSCTKIVLEYNKVIEKIKKTIMGILAGYLTVAVLAIIPTACYEYALWQRQLRIAGVIETQKEQLYDVIEFLEDFQSLIKSKLNELSSKMHFAPKPADSVLLKWLVSFALSRVMNFLIGTAFSVMLVYFGNVAILDVIRNSTSSLPSSSNVSYVPASASRSSLQLTNSNTTDILTKAGGEFYKTAEDYALKLSTKLVSILSNADLPVKILDYDLNASVVIGSLNQSQLAESLTQVTAVTDNGYGISALIDNFTTISNSHLIISLSLLGTWLVIVLGALHYVAYRHSKINK